MAKFLKVILLGLVVVLTPALLSSQAPTTSKEKIREARSRDEVLDHSTFPLADVLEQVSLALNDYQSVAEESLKDKSKPSSLLPKLKSANFDFKTTTDSSGGLLVTFLVFTIGGSRSNEISNDVSFQYQVPDHFQMPSTASLNNNSKPKVLRENLVATIRAAGSTLSNAPTFRDLPFKELSVTVSFGVKWDGKTGVSVPALVTSKLNYEKSKNAVQTVKLTFERP